MILYQVLNCCFQKSGKHQLSSVLQYPTRSTTRRQQQRFRLFCLGIHSVGETVPTHRNITGKIIPNWHTHRIHVWYICPHVWWFFLVNVGIKKWIIHGSYGIQLTFVLILSWIKPGLSPTLQIQVSTQNMGWKAFVWDGENMISCNKIDTYIT